MNSTAVVLDFLASINKHDTGLLAKLMSSDHVFVDSLGNSVSGREKTLPGWQAYFTFCPDYWVSHEPLGAAGGTIESIRWRTPAAWFAIVADGVVKEWRVYADNKPVYEILAHASPPAGGR